MRYFLFTLILIRSEAKASIKKIQKLIPKYAGANPDLVERIRQEAPLNKARPEFFYGSSHEGYTDYPFLGSPPQ